MQNQKKIINITELLLASLIWGIAFVAQSEGVKHIGSFTFNALRFILGGIVLLPIIAIFDKKPKSKDGCKSNKTLFLGGILCGCVLCLSSTLQQLGIALGAPVGKAGFLTALYIVLVPVIGIFLGKKSSPIVWICVGAAVVGMYFLCIDPKQQQLSLLISISEILLILCAVGFSVHILVIDKYSPLVSGIKLSCIQFFVAGLISTVLCLVFETPSLAGIWAAAMPILYAGIMSCGVAYTLQIVGQKNFNPAIASLLLSLESVFSMLAGFILLKQTLSAREIAGCAIMMAAIILVQIPTKQKEDKQS